MTILKDIEDTLDNKRRIFKTQAKTIKKQTQELNKQKYFSPNPELCELLQDNIQTLTDNNIEIASDITDLENMIEEYPKLEAQDIVSKMLFDIINGKKQKE